MTFYYKTYSFPQGERGIPKETRKLWELIADKKNWRIVQLPNGFYQAEYNRDDGWVDVTRRETIDACETAIDKSIEHYKKKLDFADGPKVIKTFDK
tara:strand:- start:286 stop:573 length:288 start_codon:yes stop_codon:yes gene_type:complete